MFASESASTPEFPGEGSIVTLVWLRKGEKEILRENVRKRNGKIGWSKRKLAISGAEEKRKLEKLGRNALRMK